MQRIKYVDKDILREKAETKMDGGFIPKQSQLISVVRPFMRGDVIAEPEMYKAAEKAQTLGTAHLKMSERIKMYGGAFHVPVTSQTASKKSNKKIKMSVAEMVAKGYFSPKMSANTLPGDWQSLWDALRIDISIQKTAMETVRQNFYKIQDNPNASKTMKITELFPYAGEFKLNNAEGQSVNQMETRGGQVETLEHFLYSLGFTRTLMDVLYDESFDPQKLANAVVMAQNGKQDDLSMRPILDYVYSGDQQTPASTTGANAQEKLYNTGKAAVRDLGARRDPITERRLNVNNLTLLCSPSDAIRWQEVLNGFTNDVKGGQDAPKNLNPIRQITKIVAYDGETIRGRVKDVIYDGVTDGVSYLFKDNRYMNISKKRNLTVVADMNPDVTTFAQEKRSYYFAEGQQTTGIEDFIQEVTLPADDI